MDRLMSRLVGTFVLAAMLIFVTGTAYSQTDSTSTHKMDQKKNSAYQNAKYDKDVADAASILRTKVDLTMEQTTRVEGILQAYKDKASRKDMKAANDNKMSTAKDNTLDKINNVLTAEQKTKFENVKTQWWSDTVQKLSTGSSTGTFKSESKSDTTWKK